MNATSLIKQTLIILATSSVLAAGSARAQVDSTDDSSSGVRWEAWLALSVWPSLNDLQPVAGGSFNQIGYGIGGSAHWPVRQLESGELLVGVEGAIMATDSDVPVLLDDLLARDGYLAVSAKWMMGKSRKFSLDAGLAYHLVDISQLESDYDASVEFESWEENAAGFFLGTSWDVGAGRAGKDSGLSLGLKVHFLDFGTVHDEDIFITPVLGVDAGDLDGPVYALQIGYRWR